jgi:hypothetical protein
MDMEALELAVRINLGAAYQRAMEKRVQSTCDVSVSCVSGVRVEFEAG